jgi:glycosyltransferase involved in cell wall biosynthesis
MKRLSIVVPIYNEASGILRLWQELRRVMETLPYEAAYVFVNDGSTDASGAVLETLTADPAVTYVELSRNFGKEIATSAGIAYTQSDAVIIIDADLQHPPEELWSRIPTDNKSVDIRGSNQWKSIHLEGWPGFDVDKISSDMVTIAVQINGKLRHTLSIQQSVVSSQQQLEDLAKNSENVKKHLEGKEIKKVIYVPGKILNFVI